VARDRKRAKQRQQQRRVQRGAPVPGSGPVRADLPGALEHASGEVEEFDAALVRGAQGVPMPDASAVAAETDAEANGSGVELLDTANTAPADTAVAPGAAAPSAPRDRRLPLHRRAVSFLRASWAELQRVQWPNRTQVSQATAVVLGFVVIAGLYLGAADWVAQRIVNFIL
jgi:preprotein translocase SecE subunit